MILIPILAVAVGIALGILLRVPLEERFAVYLGVLVVAGMDSVFGGVRSALESKFRSDIFVTGFFGNMTIALLFAFFGDQIGVDLHAVAILVMGWRIFTNLSVIRRQMLTKWHDTRERRRLEAEAQAQQGEESQAPRATAT